MNPDTEPDNSSDEELIILRPLATTDGSDLWRLAKNTGVLDTNTPYAYLLWARDFGRNSVIAEVDGVPAGFISGYMRPGAPQTLFIWQVAVDANYRGRGLAKKMLDDVIARNPARRLETTITEDNAASIALFTALARDHDTVLEHKALFSADMFPSDTDAADPHLAEDLYFVEPLKER